jgi:hypothetical protein
MGLLGIGIPEYVTAGIRGRELEEQKLPIAIARMQRGKQREKADCF